MPNLSIQFSPTNNKKEYVVTLDAHRFERLAATFGFFNPDFIKSLDQAERDIKKGKIREITSLKELRKKKV